MRYFNIKFAPNRFVITFHHFHASIVPVKNKKSYNTNKKLDITLNPYETYCIIEATTGHSKLHSVSCFVRLSRYNILSHQAGMRFFSPESYPFRRIMEKTSVLDSFEHQRNTCRFDASFKYRVSLILNNQGKIQFSFTPQMISFVFENIIIKYEYRL